MWPHTCKPSRFRFGYQTGQVCGPLIPTYSSGYWWFGYCSACKLKSTSKVVKYIHDCFDRDSVRVSQTFTAASYGSSDHKRPWTELQEFSGLLSMIYRLKKGLVIKFQNYAQTTVTSIWVPLYWNKRNHISSQHVSHQHLKWEACCRYEKRQQTYYQIFQPSILLS